MISRVMVFSILLGIAFVVSMSMPACMCGGRSKANRRESTRAMIMSLGASLERYKVDFDSYPPSPALGSADDGTLAEFLIGKDGRGVTANAGTNRMRHYEPYLTLGREFFRTEGTRLIIVDAWGMPIHYFNSKAFVEGGGNPKFVHNPASVDLYSTGQNRVKDAGLIEPGTGEVKAKEGNGLVGAITNF